MKLRNTLILAVVVLLAGVLFYTLVVREESRITPTEDRKERAKKLLPFERDEVSAIKVVRKDGEVALERSKKKWRLVAPVQARADSSRIDSLLSDLEYLKKEGTIKEGDLPETVLAAYGLDAPRFSLSVTIGGEERTLQFGALDAQKDNVYVKLADEPTVYLTDDGILRKLDEPVEYFRERRLTELTRYDIDGLVLASREQTIELAKQEGRWRLLQPINARASRERIEDLLGKLTDLEADSFVTDKPEDLAAYGLDRPVVATTLKKGEEKVKVLFGKTLADRLNIYAKNDAETTVVTLKIDILDELGVTADDFRDRQVTHLVAANVEQLEVKLPKEVVKFRKEDDKWQFVDRAGLAIDSSAVDDFVKSVQDAQIEKFVAEEVSDPAKYGLAEPRAVITLPTSSETESFRLGAQTEELAYLQLPGEEGVVGVASDFASQVFRGTLNFRSRLMAEVKKADLEEVRIQREDALFVAEKVGNDWKLTKPVEAEADSSVINNFLYDFDFFRAEKLLGEATTAEDLKPYGLDKPSIRLTLKAVKTDGTIQEKTLLVGSEWEEGFAAKLEDAPMVFTVSESFVKKLTAELRNRSVFAFDKEKVVGLSLMLDGEKQEAAKEGGEWKLTEPADAEFNKYNLDDILDLLDDLKTERFANYRAEDLKPYGLDEPVLTATVKLPLREETLLVGAAKDEKNVYALARGSRSVFLMKKDDVEELEEGLVKKPEASEPSASSDEQTSRDE